MHLFPVCALCLMLTTSGLSPAQAKPPQGRAQSAAGLPSEVVQALRQAQVPLQNLSVVVAPLPNAAQPQALPARLSHRADARMNPASVMKLITTYAGLSLLGPDFTWRNRVYVDGPVSNGVLQGNLILRGSGDPKLVLERVQDLMAQIQAQGVREVRGDIVLDRSVFDIQPRAPRCFKTDRKSVV
jgi:D-alanyl-D-alanine carboxypeptidase/D-alanyl-D-alanine-endopeptidase (penicillin-binding protein 4)